VFRPVSLNLNGIRCAAAKEFEAWAEGVGADCMGVQEVNGPADIVARRLDPQRSAAGARIARPACPSIHAAIVGARHDP
jgi:exonuclease III